LIQNFAGIVSPITDLLCNDINFDWGEAQEGAFPKLTIVFTSRKTGILSNYLLDRPVLFNMDACHVVIAGVLSQKFKDSEIHLVGLVSRKCNPAELNRNVYDTEMLGVVLSLRMNQFYLQGAEHQTTIFSHLQNLAYMKSAILLIRRQARWSDDVKQYTLPMLYWKESFNPKADNLAMCLAFTSREGGTTSATKQTMLYKEQWLEVGAIELDLGVNFETIQIAAIEVKQMLPEVKSRIKVNAMLDEKYR
jgi:hypothetical protein